MTVIDYSSFIANKTFSNEASGIVVSDSDLNPNLFPFQRDLVKLALRQGKFCLWANTGLGKTIKQLSWADALHKIKDINVLILAPLGVAKQTVREGIKFGIKTKYCKSQSEVVPGITITNYERLHQFDASYFDAIVLDESSILKDETSSTRNQIINTFRNTPYKLACSATPAPNDYMELGNQCEFLGVMTRNEMLSMFFTHDGGETAKWRLKNHAQDKFWEFVSSWAVMVQMPSDLGYSDDGYVLPPIQFFTHRLNTRIKPPEGQLLFDMLNGLQGQRFVRKSSLHDRCNKALEIVNSQSDKQWLIWCETNDESALLSQIIPKSVEIKGSDSTLHKEMTMIMFSDGKVKRLITKPSIAGMGMNWQQCHNVIYIGLTHSFEMYYQSVRRVWRFGQKNDVNAHIIQHCLEGHIEANLKRKEREASEMAKSMVRHMQARNMEMLEKVKRISVDYNPQIDMIIPDWLVTETV